MVDYFKDLPEPQALLALATEELAAKLLFQFRASARVAAHAITNDIWSSDYAKRNDLSRNRSLMSEVQIALMESWQWLLAQGLLILDPTQSPDLGWYVLSRRARLFEDSKSFADFATARMLPKQALHRSIATPVWAAFMRGEYDVAIFLAFKQVEIEIRSASGLNPDDFGVKLARKAFDPENGPLADTSVESGERLATMHFVSGAIGAFKNPQSHRHVNVEDPIQAIEMILIANHILRLVESRQTQKE